MVDREKVIHGLNSCGNDDGHPDRCGRTECPYRDNGAWCTHELAHDAEVLVSELLKAQEPIEPQFVQDINGAYAACGKCNHKLWKLFGAEFAIAPSEMPRFCSSCGQAVKWDG